MPRLEVHRAVLALLLPPRAVVGEADLGGERVALAVQRGEPLGRDALDRDAAQRRDRQRADDRLAVEPLAGGGVDAAAAGRDPHPRDRRRVADPVPELGGHAERDRRRPLRHPQALPDLVGVEAVRADGGLLAQVGEQRRALDGLGREREHRHVAQPDDARAARPPPAATAPTESRSSRVGVGVRPRVVRVDGRGQRAERRLGAVVAPRARPRSASRRARGRSLSTHVSSPGSDGKASTSVSPSSSTSPR